MVAVPADRFLEPHGLITSQLGPTNRLLVLKRATWVPPPPPKAQREAERKAEEAAKVRQSATCVSVSVLDTWGACGLTHTRWVARPRLMQRLQLQRLLPKQRQQQHRCLPRRALAAASHAA